MEYAMSVGEDPLWIIPYTTIAVEFQDLLDDYTTYIDVSPLLVYHYVLHSPPPVFGARSMHVSTLLNPSVATQLPQSSHGLTACKMSWPSHVHGAEVVQSM